MGTSTEFWWMTYKDGYKPFVGEVEFVDGCPNQVWFAGIEMEVSPSKVTLISRCAPPPVRHETPDYSEGDSDKYSTPIDIPLGKTDRGFVRGDFIDAYGKECSIQESSLASVDCIWLGANEERMHLTRGMAAALVPLLVHFAAVGDLRVPGEPLAEAET